MDTLKTTNIPLCQLVSLGLSGPDSVLALNETPLCEVTFLAEEMRTKGQDPFPVTPTGTVMRLGIIFGSEFEEGSRTNRHVWDEIARRGLAKPPADAVDYLLRQYSRSELLNLVDSRRPKGSAEIIRKMVRVVVPHEPVHVPGWRTEGISVLSSRGCCTVSVLGVCCGRPDVGCWTRDDVFVAALP